MHMKRLNKIKFQVFILLCVLCFQRHPSRFLFYFTAAGVMCPVVAVKCLSILHHSSHFGYFENRIPLKQAGAMGVHVCSFANYI